MPPKISMPGTALRTRYAIDAVGSQWLFSTSAAHAALLRHAREVDRVDGARDAVGIGMHVDVDDTAEALAARRRRPPAGARRRRVKWISSVSMHGI